MHVLQLGPYPPPEGGINRNILAIREELLKAGHRCSVIATSRSTSIVPETDVHHPSTPFEFVKLLRQIDSDVVHLHLGGDITRRVMALAAVSSIFGRGMKVLSVHSGGYPETAEGRSARRRSIRGRIFRRFDKLIAVNGRIAEVFARYGISEKNIRVIYPFVHRLPDPDITLPEHLRNVVNEHSPVLITVGLLEPEYDLLLQIDAMERVLSEFPRAGLIIVGSGSLETELRDAIASKSYADQVLLTGDVEHKVTLHLINDSDILLRTTLFDGDAISVREALFLGTPVIATDNRMRPDGVHLIPLHDPDELVRKIGEIARQKSEKAQPTEDDMSNVHAVLKLYEN